MSGDNLIRHNRNGLDSETLQQAINSHLNQYFKSLNGMSPMLGMHGNIIAQVEKPLLENVLRYVNGNQVRAAHILGINRNSLRKKISVLEIDLTSVLDR